MGEPKKQENQDVNPEQASIKDQEVTEDNLPDIKFNSDGSEKTSDEMDADVEQKLKDAGFSLEDISKQIKESGEITTELIDQIKEKVDPQYIDAHLARLKAEAELAKKTQQEQRREQEAKTKEMNDYIYSKVDGQSNFNSLAGVLKNNLSESELSTINKLLASGDKGQIDIAMQTAINKYNTIKGKGDLMQGDAGTERQEKFEPLSKEQFRKIIQTEKYQTDPAYQRQIDKQRLETRKRDEQTFMPGQYFAQRHGQRYAI
jgi:hypothetical protein